MQPLGQPAHALLQCRQSEKHKREAGERGPRRRYAPAAQQLGQRADEDHRQRVGGQGDADADQRHEPGGSRGADVRAEDKAQPLRKGQQARADQSDRRHGRCARRLHNERDDSAPERAGERGRRRLAQHRAQRGTRERLEPLGHDSHAKQEQTNSTEDRDRRRHERAHLQEVGLGSFTGPLCSDAIEREQQRHPDHDHSGCNQSIGEHAAHRQVLLDEAVTLGMVARQLSKRGLQHAAAPPGRTVPDDWTDRSFYLSPTSSARAAANSFIFSAPTFGYARSSCSTTSTIAAATTSRVNHLLSAGTTYHGACSDAVARMASWNACM